MMPYYSVLTLLDRSFPKTVFCRGLALTAGRQRGDWTGLFLYNPNL